MSIYNTGAVTVKVGSSEVIGFRTSFASNVTTGYYFKLTGSAAWYEVATVNNATKLQLSARYSDSSHQTIRNPENIASVIVATKLYSGTLSYYPVIQGHVVINASLEKFTDDSGGILTGDGTPAGSGTVNYDTGAWTVTLGTNITATANMAASYLSGNTLNVMPYQIVTDYTSQYGIPELSAGDTSIHHIYTKAMRIIDHELWNKSASISQTNYSIYSGYNVVATSNYVYSTTASTGAEAGWIDLSISELFRTDKKIITVGVATLTATTLYLRIEGRYPTHNRAFEIYETQYTSTTSIDEALTITEICPEIRIGVKVEGTGPNNIYCGLCRTETF